MIANTTETTTQTGILYSSYVIPESGKIEPIPRQNYEPRAAFATETKGLIIEMMRGSSLEKLSPEMLIALAGLYAKTFGDAPWFEVGRCFKCGNFFQEKGIECPNDGSLVTEAYPTDWTVNYIQNELSKPNCYFVFTTTPGTGEFLSFGWGYEISIVQLAAKKYSQDLIIQEAFEDLLCESLEISPDSSVFYISEVGTDPNFRGKGLATEGFRILLNQAERCSLPSVTRTVADPPSVYGIVKNLGMQQISGPVRDSSKIILPRDTINERRVLFVKK